jgi:polyisoprenoid-binding protein YceI
MGSLFRLTSFLVTAAVVSTLPLTAVAQNEATLDLNHTTTHFAAKHLLISTVQGSIPVKSTSIAVGEDYFPTSVEAVMEMPKLDTHNEKRDNDLRSERFLDVAQFPEMTFKSTKIAHRGKDFTMDGQLTIRGVTKSVVLKGTLEGTVKDSRGRTHAGYAAATTIDRRDFNVGSTIPAAVVSNEVTITIEAEAIVS